MPYRILLLNVPFNIVAVLLYTAIGLVIYAAYQNPHGMLCDPRVNGAIRKNDQVCHD